MADVNFTGPPSLDDIIQTSSGSSELQSLLSSLQSTQGNSIFPWAYNGTETGSEAPFLGAKALMNNYAVFRYAGTHGDNHLLYDGGGAVGAGATNLSRNPTAATIIKWAQDSNGAYSPFASMPYSFADFAYCTHYGLIPNNHMITLRRFPIPVFDNLMTNDGRPLAPMAQAVTWMGDDPGNKLSDIMKFSGGLNWQEIEAQVQDVQGNEMSFNSTVSPTLGRRGGSAVNNLQGFLNPREYSGQARSETEWAQKLYGPEGSYANKVYGPVNVISQTKARKQGMRFEQKIQLSFHYTLKSIAGINPKMAMLDILANMLTLTINNAKFWGGAIRYFPAHPNIPFFGDQNAFFNGDVGGYLDSVVGKLGSLKGGFLDSLKNLMQNPGRGLADLLGGIAKLGVGGVAAKDRPVILSMRSLLTGSPVGEWHLVVGNPLNPIALIGNLVCTDYEIEFSDKLGADDFPAEMKVTITLEHGKPRDKGDVESMFNMGSGRLYYGIEDDKVFSSTHNSIIDTSGTKGEVLNNSGASFQTAAGPTQMTYPDTKSSLSMWGSKYASQGSSLNVARTWSGGGSKPGNKP